MIQLVRKTKKERNIRKMKKSLLAVGLALLGVATNVKAVTLLGGETLTGYADVFNLSGSARGASAFASEWGVADIKSTYSGGILTLQPNYNTYNNALSGDNAARAFWTSSTDGGVTAGPLGNKWFEGSTFVQNTSYNGGPLTFEFAVNSFTLNSNYSVSAWVKSFDSSWNWNGMNSVSITGAGNYSVTFNAIAGITQYGFTVAGINANPAQEASLGSVVVQGIPEPSTAGLLSLLAAGALLVRRRKV
jgi:hypothetical protein